MRTITSELAAPRDFNDWMKDQGPKGGPAPAPAPASNPDDIYIFDTSPGDETKDDIQQADPIKGAGKLPLDKVAKKMCGKGVPVGEEIKEGDDWIAHHVDEGHQGESVWIIGRSRKAVEDAMDDPEVKKHLDQVLHGSGAGPSAPTHTGWNRGRDRDAVYIDILTDHRDFYEVVFNSKTKTYTWGRDGVNAGAQQQAPAGQVTRTQIEADIAQEGVVPPSDADWQHVGL